MLFYVFSLILIILLINQNKLNLSQKNSNIILVCLLGSLYLFLTNKTQENLDKLSEDGKCILEDEHPDPDPEQVYPHFKFNYAALVYTDRNKYSLQKIYTRCLTGVNIYEENLDNNCDQSRDTRRNDFSKSRSDEAQEDYDNNVTSVRDDGPPPDMGGFDESMDGGPPADSGGMGNEGGGSNIFEGFTTKTAAEALAADAASTDNNLKLGASESYIAQHIQQFGYSESILKDKGLRNNIVHVNVKSGFKCTIYESDFESNSKTELYTYTVQDNNGRPQKRSMQIPYTIDGDGKKIYHIEIDTSILMKDPKLANMAVNEFKNLTWNNYSKGQMNIASILNPNPGSDTNHEMRTMTYANELSQLKNSEIKDKGKTSNATYIDKLNNHGL